MLDLIQGFLYHVALSLTVLLWQAQAGWALMLSSSLAGAWRSTWSSLRLLAWKQPREMAQGVGWPFWDPRRVTVQESKCSLGLRCWGLWFFWTCLWAQVRVWLLSGKALIQNQHLIPAAWAWSNKKKDQDVPGAWGSPRVPVTVQPAQMTAAGVSQKREMKRWTLPCASLCWHYRVPKPCLPSLSSCCTEVCHHVIQPHSVLGCGAFHEHKPMLIK